MPRTPKEGTKVLNCMPRELLGGEYHGTKAYALRDALVAEEFWPLDGDPRWPGRERNVAYYVRTQSGHLVGFNENVSRGWSFPVRRA